MTGPLGDDLDDLEAALLDSDIPPEVPNSDDPRPEPDPEPNGPDRRPDPALFPNPGPDPDGPDNVLIHGNVVEPDYYGIKVD